MEPVGIKITAQDSTKPAFDSVNRGLSGVASAAVSAQSSLAALGVGVSAAAFVAFSKNIINGIDALNDVKDATGSTIENISALEDVALRTGSSFETVTTALIKMNQGLNSAKPGSDIEKAFTALGLSVADLKKQDPAEVMRLTAVALSGYADDANKARITQEVFGKSLKEVAPLLNDLAESGQLNAKVTTEQAKQAEVLNKQLAVLQKTALDASRSLISNMVPAINTVIAAMKSGGLMSGLDELGNQLFDWEGNAKRKGIKNLTSDLADLRAEQAAITIDIFGKKGQIQTEIDAKIAALAAAKAAYFKITTLGGGRGTVNPENVDPRKSIGDPLGDSAAGTAGASAAAKALAAQNKELGEQAKLLAELSGLTGSFASDWDRLSLIYKKGGLSLDGLIKAQADLLAKQPAIKAATDAEAKAKEVLAKANLAAAEAHGKYITSLSDGLDKLKADTIAQQESNDRLGLSKDAIAALDAAKLESQAVTLDLLAIKTLDKNLDESQYNLYKAQAEELRKLASLKQSGASKEMAQEVAKKSAEETAAEWKKTSDQINSTLTDALMRGFESGKDFAKNLRDTVVNMFKTMVLRPIISAVMSPIAGAITGGLGLSGAASAAGTVGTAGAATGLAGTLAGLAATAASWGTAAGAGFMATLGGSTIAGGGAAGILAAGGAAGAGTAGMIGALGPYALAALAVLAIHDMTQGETRNGAKYGVGADGLAVKLEGPSGGEIAATQAQAMFNVAKSSIEGMLTGFGSKAVLTGFTAGLESSENGKGFAYATGAINGKSFGDVNTYMNSRGDKTQEQALKDYQLELTQSILEGLQVTEDIPASIAKLISDGLNGSEVKALSLEATSAILANVETLSKQVNTFNAAMTQLPFEKLKNLSFDTAAGLIAAAGGFEKLDANLTGYYANFYTAEQQRAQLITNTEASFAALGKTMPVLDGNARLAFQAMVTTAEGLDMTVAGNRTYYASLLALWKPMNELAPAFDSVTTSVADLAKAAVQATADMTSAWASVMQSRGVASNDITKFTAQASIDAAFLEYKKTDRFGIASAAQFQTITQKDFANYSGADQKLIATILTGFADLTKANTPAAQASPVDGYTAPDTSIADAIASITKGLTDAGVSLGVELLKAQGKTVEAMAAQRAIDTAGYNAAQIALYDYNQGLRDQITALGEASALQARIATERNGLQDQLDTLTMTSVELLAKQRNALDESNRALFDSINAIKAETTAKDAAIKSTAAAVAAGDATRNAAAKGGTDAMSAVQRAVDAQRKIIQVARDVAAESVSSLSSIFDAIQSSVKELYGTVDSTAQMQADQGRAFIKQSLATAQSTGYMPDGKALTDAINAAKGDTRQYSSQVDKDFAALSLAGDLSLLGEVGKDQLTAAEQALKMQDDQLAALESTLTLAQQQLDAANGINTSVLSVADALALLATAITSIKAAPPAGGTVALNAGGANYAGAGSDIKTVQDLYSVNLGRTADAAGLEFWTKAFMADGVIDAAEKQQFALSAMDEYKSIRGYASGGDHPGGYRIVGEGGPELEATGPSRIFNADQTRSMLGGGGNSNARLEQLVATLIAKVEALEAPLKNIDTSTAGHADQFDRVTEGGNALRSEIMKPVPVAA